MENHIFSRQNAGLRVLLTAIKLEIFRKYSKRKGDKIITYPEAVYYLLKTYAARKVIDEIDS